MWALNTCGEPNEIELTIRVLADDFAALFQAQSRKITVQRLGNVVGDGLQKDRK